MEMVKKVLIVDDEVSFLLSLKDGLSAHRDTFEVFTAVNGKEAVEILNEKPIDLLVTDLKLPEMDGFELLAWSSRHKPQLPVIVMSAFGTPEIETRLAGMDTLEFLDKPLDLETLEIGIMKGLKAGNRSFIRGISLATFLQLVRLENKNCTLKVSMTDASLSAFLYVRNGELIDADCGELHGREAAFEIVTWDKTEIEMDGICRRQNDIVQLPMEQLLMEAYKLKDEKLQAAVEVDAQSQAPAFGEARAGAVAETKKGSAGTDVDIKSFVALLQKQNDFQEYAVFGDGARLLFRHPVGSVLQHFDVGSLVPLAKGVSGEMGAKRWRSLVLNGSARERYLLFACGEYTVVSRLKAGARTHKIAADVMGKMSQAG
jgi:DNA-binding response OmpR family regulator